MDQSQQRRLLGEFVRAHRERMAPEAAGGRRRTPGLRREELAARAGISATWCAWIEQGREVQASPQALSRLAGALALTRAERAYLFELAARRDPAGPQPASAPEAPESVTALIHATEHPAYGLDRFWTARAWNPAAARLFGGWLDGEHDRNQLRFVFLSPAARRLLPRWQDRAGRVLAEFRADYSRGFADAGMRALVEELRAKSPVFAEAWDAQIVLEREGGRRAFLHPEDGPQEFEQHTYTPSDRPDYKVVVLVQRG